MHRKHFLFNFTNFKEKVHNFLLKRNLENYFPFFAQFEGQFKFLFFLKNSKAKSCEFFKVTKLFFNDILMKPDQKRMKIFFKLFAIIFEIYHTTTTKYYLIFLHRLEDLFFQLSAESKHKKKKNRPSSFRIIFLFYYKFYQKSVDWNLSKF